MPFIKINGFEIYYEIHGHGEDIVLLHHGFGCTKMWRDIYPPLVEMGYRVLLYDRRGYGQSEKSDDFQSFYEGGQFRSESVEELEALRQGVGLDTFHIIGQCEGGVIGVEYAAKQPGHVKTLVASSTQCYSPVTMAEFNRQKFPKPFQELDPDLRQKFSDWHGAGNADAFYNQFRRYGGAYGKGLFDLRPLLPSVACPALVLYPDRSFLFGVEQAVAFYRGLPSGELAILPNCGHNTYEERPREYVGLVLDFLERHSA